MNRLPRQTRIAVLKCLTEGASIASTCRMTGAAKMTVLKLLVQAGDVCAAYCDATLAELKTRRVEADEIWSFCYSKAKNVPAERKDEFGVGDIWTYTAIDADSKLIISWMIGPRDGGTATAFMTDVADRLTTRVQLTTDGHSMYLDAVADAFGPAVDYAMLVKHYGNEGGIPKGRYSPAECTGADKRPIVGKPDMEKVSTSYVERSNLTMRMSMRRFTRLTNAFSKKLENHVAAVALYTMHYNFCRTHQTLKTEQGYKRTPAMVAGIADHVWTVDEIVTLIEAEESMAPERVNKGGRPRKEKT